MACGAVVTGLISNYGSEISSQVAALASWQLVASAGSLVIGKILLSISAQHATRSHGWRPSLRSVLAIVSLSQLGKYIPGGIWHFVGRSALYAARGLRPISIAKTLILENVWQWASALLVGALFLLYSYYDSLNLLVARPWGVSFAAIVVCALWRWLFLWSRRRFVAAAEKVEPPETWTILALQSGAWICFGISIWTLFPVALHADGLILAIGAFSLATLAGFLVPLAPAGLGVREAVLIVMLSRELGAEQTAICAGINRLVWLAVEVGLAALLYGQVYSRPASERESPNA